MTVPSLRSRLSGRHANDPAVVAWLVSPDTLAAEQVARAGYAAVVLDQQHGALGEDETLRMLQALTLAGAPAIVRVAWNLPHLVMKALDLGAWGVIAPMLEGPEDVERLVRACRYPPLGERSYGPTRGAALADAYMPALANAEVVPIAMIETRSAFERIDEILAVEGLGAVFVGPADLSQALGGPPGADFEAGPAVAAVARIAERAQAHGVPAGIYCRSLTGAQRMLALGYGFVAVGSTLDLIAEGSRALLAALSPRPH